jgi:hypothetical protein
MSCGRALCGICRINFQGRPHCKRCIEIGRIMGGPPGPMPIIAPVTYVSMVADRLARSGFEVFNDTLSGIPITVGNKAEWILLNRIRVYVVMAQVPQVDENQAFGLSRTFYEISANRGGTLLFAGQLMSYSVISSPVIDQRAIGLVVRSKPQVHFRGWEITVLHDMNTNMVYFHPESHLFGWALYPYIHSFVRQYLIP